MARTWITKATAAPYHKCRMVLVKFIRYHRRKYHIAIRLQRELAASLGFHTVTTGKKKIESCLLKGRCAGVFLIDVCVIGFVGAEVWMHGIITIQQKSSSSTN